jgi:hypothetical protein
VIISCESEKTVDMCYQSRRLPFEYLLDFAGFNHNALC